MVDAERRGDQPADGRSTWLDCTTFMIVLAIAIAIAVTMWLAYARAPDLLWRGFYHDRNSHYSFGLDLALAARNLDPAWFFSELEKAKVWPPFHGLILGAVLLIGGIDHRLAIVPSLIGWVMTLAFVWLITRRMLASRIEGLFAASLAVILTAASPVFRLISADVMLEGLGAGLSAAALWAYLRASAEPTSAARWRLLAVLLTVLFFHKGNYWGLLLIPIGIAFALERGRDTMRLARVLGQTKVGPLLLTVLRQPLLILAALAAGLVAFIYARGPTALDLFGRSVSLYPPENLTTLAFALVFVWWSLLWWRNKAAIDAALGVPGRALLYWHLTPVAISFLLPHRLSRFLWFVGPANSPQGNTGIWDGAQFYWRVFTESYHVAPWMALPVAALALIGALGLPRLAPGSRVVFLFAAVAWLGVVIHPQHQGRFMSTWVFAVWICAGIGAALLLQRLRRIVSPWVRGLIAAAGVASLLAVTIGRPIPETAYAAAIHPNEGPSDLALVSPYLTELDGAREVAVFTTFGTSKLFAWVMRERCRCNRLVDDPFIDHQPTREDVRQLTRERIAQSTADVVVVIDAPDSVYSSSLLGWDYARMAGIVDAMAGQTRYKRTATYDLPDQQGRATIWRRS